MLMCRDFNLLRSASVPCALWTRDTRGLKEEEEGTNMTATVVIEVAVTVSRKRKRVTYFPVHCGGETQRNNDRE